MRQQESEKKVRRAISIFLMITLTVAVLCLIALLAINAGMVH